MDETATAEATEKFTIKLPDFNDDNAVDEFLFTIRDHQEVRGVPTLVKRVKAWQRHQVQLGKLHKLMKSSIAYINGERSTKQLKADSKRSLRYKAHEYFNSLSTPMLHEQCKLFGITYDAYDSVESVIDALVQKNIEMTS